MCGIAGLVCPTGTAAAQHREALERAIQAQHHRGPDSNGVLVHENVGLAHNRLSILDLSEHGAQPMMSRSGRYTIAYNGEIYNFRALAQELGLELRSGSDTEVLLEAYEQLGPDLFPRLNGMFAFALHDRIEGVLWLVRDRLGIKPLYYAHHERTLLFSSEIKGLFALAPDYDRRLNANALHEWTYFGNALGERTLFDGVVQLEPGCALRVDLATGSERGNAYWTLEQARKEALTRRPEMRDVEAAAAHTRDVLQRAVQRHMVADVPVGVFLSGGLDSSSIATFAAQNRDKPLTTYSAAFDHDTKNSELALAREVAEGLGTDHHEIRIHGTQTPDVIQKMIEAHDLPFSDAANIPLYMMCEKIRNSHKVILQGDGGDEMFAGYQRHLTLQRVARYRPLLRALQPVAGSFAGNLRGRRIARMVEALGAATDARTMALLLTVERTKEDPSHIFQTGIRNTLEEAAFDARYAEMDARFADASLAERMLLTDKMVILPDIFFQKVDRSTMAASVEVRVPFVDNEVLDLVLAIPPEVLMTGGEQKGLLRKAMQSHLPNSVLTGKKRGFGVPFGKWVTGPLLAHARDAIDTAAAAHPEIFNKPAIDRLIDTHLQGRADNGFLIWKTFNLALWLVLQKVSV